MANDTDPAPTTRTEEREPVEPSPDESGPDQPSPDRPNPDQPAPDTTDDAAFYSKGPLRLRGSQVPTTTTDQRLLE